MTSLVKAKTPLNQSIPLSAGPAPKRKKASAAHIATYVFIALMLLYPVAHFCLMWFGVNITSILLTFQTPVHNKLTWVMSDWNHDAGTFFSTLFINYSNWWESFRNDTTSNFIYANSLIYFVVSCLVTLPIAMFFSYFVFKKIWGSTFYKVIFFIPSILPLFILTTVYTYSLNQGGLISGLLDSLHIDYGSFFQNLFVLDNSKKWLVWVFCVWAGIGYDVILLTAGMSRIPRDILESCKMDGVNPFKEFFRIIVPLTWPTITTLFVFGMMSVFNVTFQPFFITGESANSATETIGMNIYFASQGSAKNIPATMGLICSLVGAPIICLVRWGMNKCFKNVGF
jgi:ABC-type sugar transport system permease subunit